MSDTIKESGGTGPSHRGVEIGVAAFMAILALIGIYGSFKVGIGWGAEGPQPGSLPVLCQPGRHHRLRGEISRNYSQPRMKASLFASWNQLRLVLAVVVPTAIYVAAIPFLGNLCSLRAARSSAFMKWLGRLSPGSR